MSKWSLLGDFKGRLLALPANNKLGLRWLVKLITTLKSFKVHTPTAIFIFFLTYKWAKNTKL